VRVSFVIDDAGTSENLSVWPVRPALLTCLTVQWRALRFPASKQGRHLASYTLALAESEPRTRSSDLEVVEEDAFWTRAQLRGAQARETDRQPWWRDQNSWVNAIEESAKSAPVAPGAGQGESGSNEADPTPADEAARGWWTPQP
jgi:hypothetical protein